MRPRSTALPILLVILLPLALVLAGAQQPPPAPTPAATPSQQPGQVTLVLPGNGQQRKIKIAFPAFRGQLGGDGATAARELEETVRRDLDSSGYFVIQGPDVLSGLHLTGDVQKDLAAYKSRARSRTSRTGWSSTAGCSTPPAARPRSPSATAARTPSAGAWPTPSPTRSCAP